MVLAKSPPLSVFAAPFSCFFLVLFFVVAGLGGAVVPGARAGDDPAFSDAEAAFPHALNPFGLKPDPAVRWGRLDHGLRYALMRNETPRDQLSFYLRVDVGSLDEEPDQGGIAHFLEHLAFQKSRRHPDEGLFSELERMGLQSGADSNASTGLEATTYHLTLPGSDFARAEQLLAVLRDIADGLLITPKDVAQERAVVISELIARDSTAAKASRAFMRFLAPDSTAAEQWPGGTRESLETIDADDLKAFYQAHYRPEKMILVVVGDQDVERMEAAIVKHFADFKGRGPAAPMADEAAIADLPAPPRAASHIAPGLRPMVAVNFEQDRTALLRRSIAYSGRYRLEPADADRRDEILRQSFALDFALAAFQRRVQDLMFGADAGFSAGGASFDHIPRAAYFFGFSFTPAGDDWQKALAVLRREADRLRLYGITEAELDLMRISQKKALETAAERADTRSSGALASQILSSVASSYVFRHPRDQLADFARVADAITTDDVKTAVRGLFYAGDHGALRQPLIFVRQGESAPEDAGGKDLDAAGIMAAWDQAGDQKPPPWEMAARSDFAYQSFGPPGTVIQREEIADFGIFRLHFANQAVAQIKESDLEQNLVRFSIRVGNGLSLYHPDEAGLILKTRQLAVLGGLGAHDFQALAAIMADQSLSVSLSIDPEGIRILGAAIVEDLPLALNYATAMLSDLAFRAEAEPLYERGVTQLYTGLRSSPQAVMQVDGLPFVLAGDRRKIGLPESLEKALAPDREAIMARIKPFLLSDFLEISLVGAIGLAEAETLLASTVGALPERAAQPAQSLPIIPSYAENGASASFTYRGEDAGSQNVLFWPVRDEIPRKKALALHLLTSVLSIKAREDVREMDGLSYAPRASWQLASGLSYRGLISLSADSDALRSDAVIKALKALLDDVADHPISDDLLDRARLPVVEQLSRWRDSNEGWLFGVLEGLSHAPDRLDRYRTVAADYSAITARDVQEAAQWLRQTGAPIKVIVEPDQKS
ncbi:MULTISPECIES: insulinase family protein [unclassified Iodidimonas]|jgi:zinc protease|uniref:M16 family metallopeptidase n=1 Tax=unclassified Iodidimonas TaxID=2626145 RepID=UPI0024827D98|nr:MULTISPECIES: insulinase family protein [unclassified Iodidimonas]